MHLEFDIGDRDAPRGHALIYFRADNGAILATYVTVPPIPFDLSEFVPGFLAGALQGMDLTDALVATPMPPIPQDVAGLEYLRELAGRRHDDLVYGGAVIRSDPMRLAAETAEAARGYGELYKAITPAPAPAERARVAYTPDTEPSRFASMNSGEQLNELTLLTGRLRDTIVRGSPDIEVEREMEELAHVMPAKYRVRDVITAAHVPGDRGHRLAELHIERCYKLFHEDYLDLQRIDAEIEALHD